MYQTRKNGGLITILNKRTIWITSESIIVNSKCQKLALICVNCKLLSPLVSFFMPVKLSIVAWHFKMCQIFPTNCLNYRLGSSLEFKQRIMYIKNMFFLLYWAFFLVHMLVFTMFPVQSDQLHEKSIILF